MQQISPLQKANTVPNFSTTDSEGNSFSKEILLGQKYLLYFYPRDNTPGCTAQACGFRDHYCFFQNKEIKIFGISGGSRITHENFRQKFRLPFPLLLDEQNKIAKLFGVWGEKKIYGAYIRRNSPSFISYYQIGDRRKHLFKGKSKKSPRRTCSGITGQKE